ncbi:MAG TPA: putative inorganic carbon transporter subunit DabA, partial [Nitrospira sp.]|nr:putative inorganic carbon transporter subunit DabA [Nitrospira sp.]
MTTPLQQAVTDAERMELRAYVQLAGEVLAQYWPMRTFIHHNPLHGLESLSFDQAVKRGAQLFGGRGYLSNERFRKYFQQGRIRKSDLAAALRPLAVNKEVQFGGHATTHLDVLMVSMTHGVLEPSAMITVTPETAEADLETNQAVANHLASILPTRPAVTPLSRPQGDSAALPTLESLSTWCDQTLGTSIVETIDQELVKWCSVFLDEGEAGWAMPHREKKFFRAWKSLAQYDGVFRCLGIKQAGRRIRALPDRTEDAVLDSMSKLALPKPIWEEYLSLHLAALPGWTGYIKWRSDHDSYPWQQQFPIDLVKYLAVRLFYERELVEHSCRNRLGIRGTYDEIRQFMDDYPHACWLRREWVAGRLSPAGSDLARQLAGSGRRLELAAWEDLGRAQYGHHAGENERRALEQSTQSLVRLARALNIPPSDIPSTPGPDLLALLDWLSEFPPSLHGPHWLDAFEMNHRRQFLHRLCTAGSGSGDSHPLPGDGLSRPLAQVVFCIDVRSEVFRRHLEQRGGYETLGLAGFFGVPLDYQPFSTSLTVTQCPVLLKPKNQIREIPRSYHGILAERHKTVARLGEAGHLMLHDLKENVVTPYVMVEALGWFFGLPLLGKTLCPRWYYRAVRWITQLFLPPVATTLTVEKITREAADDMITTEQHAHIREILRERFGLQGTALSPVLLDKIRKKAIGSAEDVNGEVARALGLDATTEEAFYRDLRERYRISPRGISDRLDRLTHTGFSVAEQAYFVEAALRLMGLTS